MTTQSMHAAWYEKQGDPQVALQLNEYLQPQKGRLKNVAQIKQYDVCGFASPKGYLQAQSYPL